MFSNLEIRAVIPASDLGRAREFYKEKLGLEPSEEYGTDLIYQAKNSSFLLYETSSAGTAQNTTANWITTDLDTLMAEMRSRGVVFEEYDFPDFKTENGVASDERGRAAWFKDSEGNIHALSQPS